MDFDPDRGDAQYRKRALWRAVAKARQRMHMAMRVCALASVVLVSLVHLASRSSALEAHPTLKPQSILKTQLGSDPTVPLEVDLELVLAVDISLSMDLGEQQLQRDGYVAAFRDPEVHAAIRSGVLGRIAVTYVEWAGTTAQHVVVPWRIVDSPAAAEEFASELQERPIERRRRTSISSGLRFSAALIERNAIQGLRRAIDVSGDGPNNMGAFVDQMRDQVVAQGIVINGLPLMLRPGSFLGFDDPRELADYYEDCVIGGTGAFLIGVTSREEISRAIRRKLILEISAVPPGRWHGEPIPIRYNQAAGESGTARTRSRITDCQIGEKLWQRWMQHNDWE